MIEFINMISTIKTQTQLKVIIRNDELGPTEAGIIATTTDGQSGFFHNPEYRLPVFANELRAIADKLEELNANH